MPLRSLFAIVLGLAVAATATAESAFFPRRPAISPDGQTVVFTCQGDLWRVPAAGGRAERLTANPAYDQEPVFSPDGARLAFASDREGDADVYVMPAAGGRPERLTFAPSADLPQDFSADGREVYFASARPWRYPVRAQIQRVPVGGGTPLRLCDLFADEVAVHPDGRLLLAVGDRTFGRVGYRGTYQADLWLYEPGRAPVRVTDGAGYDTDPMWGPDGSIYWRAEDDETGAFNLWRRDADGASRRRLTDFREEGVRNARASRDGSRIVCEADDGLFILETATGELRALAIEVAADEIAKPAVQTDVTADADELAIADGGDEIAMVVRGEIVLVNRQIEGRAAVAVPSPWRERHVAFRPGSADTLVFVSDRERDGDVPYDRIGLLVSDDPESALLRTARRLRIVWLTPPGVVCSRPVWSPDGERIAYRHGPGTLAVIDADGGGRTVVYEGWDDPEFAWSPDSRWLAYAAAGGPDFNTDVWLVPAAGGRAVNVSQHPDVDSGPVWNESGSLLAWTSRRYGNQDDVVFCYLTRADHERSKEEWQIWEKTRDDGKEKAAGKKGRGKRDPDDDDRDRDERKEARKVEPIRIDLEDIHLRIRRLTDLPGDERAIASHPQGDRIVFSAEIGEQRDLYTVDRFGEDRQALTKGGAGDRAALLADDGETVWLLKEGRPARVPLEGGEVKTVSFRARLTTDRDGQRRQVVEEAWRRLRDGFYDPELHGIDWPAQRAKALRLAAGVDHDADFADVMNIMLRSLNASHMGYYPGGRGERGAAAWLGVELDPGHEGEDLRISRVVPGGPADLAEVGLAAGDVLLRVDGTPVGRTANLYAPIVAAGGDPVRVAYRRGDEEREVTLRPVAWGQLRQAIYEADVKANRAKVEEMSDGTVGYIHIQGMGQREVELFERDLYAAASGKDALVIDVRWNGGGWTTDLLLTMLTQPVHAYTIPRGGEAGYPDSERLPLQRWNKPIAVVCDESSYSNAEIFSHAVKTIGRGPVVGQTTGGNVISTGGWTTLDGAHVRLPFRGWYVWGDAREPGRNDTNQEHGGCVPDHLVPLGPPEVLANVDPQLAKAVELMRAAAAAVRREPAPAPRRASAGR
ncbi:MAG TPA: S41 family peptidase [Candidatus Krumholzibacteria bacterium]|nr:S41 family peptidase [Candidatus Krumholzibacteria bacterium]HPD70854.1 S41 family peptidase [Candidatus Krumholzibacteria bacterium]HRY39446.1 S41 family peptidase [Candidatus Krumholzibacteria bacterium]